MDSLAGAEDFFSRLPGELCGFDGFPPSFPVLWLAVLGMRIFFLQKKSGPEDGAGIFGTNAVLGRDGVRQLH